MRMQIGQGEAKHRICKMLQLGSGQVTKLPLEHKLSKIRYILVYKALAAKRHCIYCKHVTA
jgi:hypothetical protein